jgi:hypothetical protein
MLEDQGTCLAMEQCISGAGKQANSEGLAHAVTAYWSSLDLETSLSDRELAPRTAREWFRRMGYRWIDLKKGVYKDGHERADVIAYREDVFLPRLAELEKSFVRWTYPDDTEEPVLIYPDPENLFPNTPPRIPITHDECSFNAKDGIKQGWVKGDNIAFFDKGRGVSIMVSEYMTPGGNLQMAPNTPADQQPREPDGDRFRECTQIFEPKQEGEWWSGAHMEYQLQHLTIPLFEAQWPGHQAVFLFDNATNHTAFAADALRTCNMNLSSGGEQNHNMRDGWNPLTQQPQPMYTLIGRRKVAKGMRQVLEERGLWQSGNLK